VVLAAGGGGSKHPGSSGAKSASASSAPSKSHKAAAPKGAAPRRGEGLVTPAQQAAVAKLASYSLPVYCAGPHGHDLAFTFDDGPGPYTHYAITKLRQAGQTATFFAVGRSITNYPGWLQREERVATIGDHTMTHPVLPEMSATEIDQQISGAKSMIQRATGQTVQLFRPPYGSRNATVDGIAKQMGLLEIIWNVDSADSLGANYAGIIKNVEAGMHPGSIILMHENRGQTIRALTTILPVLKARGLHSVTLPALLASDPPSLQQLRAGGNGCGASVLHGSGG
jgi:peptidoglycan/xylan/chitin deacetylase (PgdA/CDA1 family)